MHDRQKVFAEFDLKKGKVVLDLGCGPGDYAIECAQIIGATGLVYALDRQKELLDDLSERAGKIGLGNIRTMPRDITLPLPMEDNSVDLCIMVTVLHIPGVSDKEEKLHEVEI
jgi:ubiquinone/menaquinone biosynthesis C-methylase UbiE